MILASISFHAIIVKPFEDNWCDCTKSLGINSVCLFSLSGLKLLA